MSPMVILLLLAAGLSEAVGRIVPMVAARREATGRPVAHPTGLAFLLVGAVAEGTVFALWPPTAWAVVELLRPDLTATPPPGWTPELIAPLLLAAVLAFPLIGPLLHLLLLVGVGAGLAGAISEAGTTPWAVAAGCVTLAGAALALVVGVARRSVASAVRLHRAVRTVG